MHAGTDHIQNTPGSAGDLSIIEQAISNTSLPVHYLGIVVHNGAISEPNLLVGDYR
jgi:hypothetical protein